MIFSPLGIRLTDKTLPVLFRQLKKHASKWREIGLHLGFLPGELSNIEARPTLLQGAPVSYLGALLEELIQWAPGDSRGSTSFTTLDSLKAALNDAGLGAAAHDLKIETGSGITEDEGIEITELMFLVFKFFVTDKLFVYSNRTCIQLFIMGMFCWHCNN